MAGGGKIKALEVCELLNFVSALQAFGFVETGYLDLANAALTKSILRLFGLGFSFFDFLDVLGWFFVEVFQTTIATKLDFASLGGEYIGFADWTQLFAGNDTRFERIGLGLRVRGKAKQRRSEERNC